MPMCLRSRKRDSSESSDVGAPKRPNTRSRSAQNHSCSASGETRPAAASGSANRSQSPQDRRDTEEPTAPEAAPLSSNASRDTSATENYQLEQQQDGDIQFVLERPADPENMRRLTERRKQAYHEESLRVAEQVMALPEIQAQVNNISNLLTVLDKNLQTFGVDLNSKLSVDCKNPSRTSAALESHASRPSDSASSSEDAATSQFPEPEPSTSAAVAVPTTFTRAQKRTARMSTGSRLSRQREGLEEHQLREEDQEDEDDVDASSPPFLSQGRENQRRKAHQLFSEFEAFLHQEQESHCFDLAVLADLEMRYRNLRKAKGRQADEISRRYKKLEDRWQRASEARRDACPDVVESAIDPVRETELNRFLSKNAEDEAYLDRALQAALEEWTKKKEEVQTKEQLSSARIDAREALEKITENVQCNVCYCTLHVPYTLSQCGHSFCLGCIVKVKSHSPVDPNSPQNKAFSCSQCRMRNRTAVKSWNLAKIAETFKLASPGLYQTAANIAELDKAVEEARRVPGEFQGEMFKLT